MTVEQYRAKYSALLKAIQSGVPCAAAGRQFGFSRCHVHQICAHAEIVPPKRGKPSWREQHAEAIARRRDTRIRKTLAMVRERERGLTYAEIGQMFGMSGEAAHTRILRARPDLRTRRALPCPSSRSADINLTL